MLPGEAALEAAARIDAEEARKVAESEARRKDEVHELTKIGMVSKIHVG